MPKWIAKEWNVANQPNQNGNYVEIEARQNGAFAWLLEKVGIDASKRITIDEENLVVEEGSLKGDVRKVVPLRKVSTTESGYSKPFYTSAALFLAGLPLFVIGSLIGVVYYALNKQLTIGFKGSGGLDVSMNLKTKGLGGQELSEEHATQVSNVVQNLLRDSNGSGTARKELPEAELEPSDRTSPSVPNAQPQRA